MSRIERINHKKWTVLFFFTRKDSSFRFYSTMSVEAVDCVSAVTKAEASLDEMDTEMCWGIYSITGVKQDDR